MRNLKHNKIRNTGLLYEFLLMQITADILNKIDTEEEALDTGSTVQKTTTTQGFAERRSK